MERESDKLTRSASRSETIQRTCLCQRVRQRPREDAGQNDARERAGHQVNGVVERPLLEVAVEEEFEDPLADEGQCAGSGDNPHVEAAVGEKRENSAAPGLRMM